MSDSNQDTHQSFEDAMQELESLVSEMESGDLPLEQALAKFERGVVLARSSQKLLKQAEQRVQILMSQNGQESLQPLQQDQDDE